MASGSAARRIAADYLREQFEMDGLSTGALSSIFESEPPKLNTFLYDSAYLNSMRPTLPTVDESGTPFKLTPIQWDFLRNFEQVLKPELYIAMVEEFGPEWAPLPMKNDFAIEWGKCPVKGEMVYNSRDGSWTKIEDLVTESQMSSVDPSTGKIHTSRGTRSWVSGVGPCVEVVTATGAKTRVYEGHKFLTPDGWCEAKDLRVGDRVANAYKLTASEPKSLPDEHVELLGFLLGDGCVSSSRNGIRMFFHADEVNAISRYCAILDTLGLTPSVHRDNLQVTVTCGTDRTICSNGHHMTEENRYILPSGKSKCRTCRYEAGRRAASRKRGDSTPIKQVGRKNSPLRTITETYGILGTVAHTKHIPTEVFSLSDDQISLFLSRLWGTDGTVEYNKLSYTSVSEDLARGVYLLLKRLGIRSTLRKRKTAWSHNGERKTSHAWVVVVQSRKDVLAFNSSIRMLDKYPQQDKLSEYMKGVKSRETLHLHGDITWDQIRSIEPIGNMEYYDLTVEGLENYVCTDGVIAHNSSGKDSVVRLGFTRIASLLQHMVSPQSYYGMASFDSIHFLSVAVNSQQARDAFFDPMKKLFKNNKYLSGMFSGDDPAEGSNRIKLKKNVTIISGHSLAESQEGLNLLAAVADEISAFKVAEEFKFKGDGRSARSADEIIGMLRSSASTRFPQTYKVVQISWPRFSGDAIEKAISQGNASIKKYGEESPWFVSGPHATWEVKPWLTKDDFKHHFEEDPEGSAAKYECNPPKASSGFMRDEERINAAFSRVADPEPIDVEYYWGYPPQVDGSHDMGGLKPQEGWQVKFNFSPYLEPVEGALYTLHGDMAVRGDRAGVAMSHVKTYLGDGDDERPVVKNDFTFAFESDLRDAERPREVQIRWYRQLIWELIERGFTVEMVTFDGWQSTDMIQSLNLYGIESKLLSLDRNDKVYQALKDVIYDGRLDAYCLPTQPETQVMRELKRLRRVKKKIDHLPNYSKDEADALAGSVFDAIQVGGEEDDLDLNQPSSSGFDPYVPDEISMAMYGGSAGANRFGLFGQGNAQLNKGYFR